MSSGALNRRAELSVALQQQLQLAVPDPGYGIAESARDRAQAGDGPPRRALRFAAMEHGTAESDDKGGIGGENEGPGQAHGQGEGDERMEGW